MLQTIRERATGWIAWVIVALISVPFALWGIQSYLGVGSAPIAASVNGLEITQRELDARYQQTRRRLREQLGASYRPEMFDEQTMRTQVLDRMVRETVLLQVSYDMGLRASDQEMRMAIVGNPAFQREGRFDKATYDRMLELQGIRPPQYEEDLRQRIVGTQLSRALTASELVTDEEIDEAIRLDHQERRVSFVRIPVSGFDGDDPIPEEDIAAYYEANQERFLTPERVKLDYLLLDAERIGAAQTPDEQELRLLYEQETARFGQPEQRRARHILVTLDAKADEQAATSAKARIDEIRTRIASGEDFGELAKELSEDPGSAGQSGDLGWFERGLMDPAFDQAVFDLAADELSEPVRSQFGYHLIQLQEIRPEHVQAFEEVRDQLASEATKNRSEGIFYDWAERLANLSYENPDSLEPAAEVLGIELHSSDWIGRKGGEGILANRKVIAAAFSDDVLQEGLNSDLLEPEPDVLQALVLRVVEHEEAAAKPLDEVRDQIVDTLREERASKAAIAAAEDMVTRLQAGEEVALGSGDYQITEAGLIGRKARDIPNGIRELAFALPRPLEGAASYGSEMLDNGDAAVIILTEVIDGSTDSLDDAQRVQAKSEVERNTSDRYYGELLEDLERRAKIERTPIAVEASL